MENIQCSCESDNVGIFPCAGAANVGQLSNKAALYLSQVRCRHNDVHSRYRRPPTGHHQIRTKM